MNSSLSRVRSVLSPNLINIPGSRFRRKIVVIESDDWGSIRMPSKGVYSEFLSRGFDIANSDYNRLDALESNNDLTQLYDMLSSQQDYRGNHPVFTANMVVGNPDFQKIRESDFSEYHFEFSSETLKRYPGRDQVEKLWKQGYSSGIFHPQFHGREHVNVIRWMNALREKSPEMAFTFDKETTFSGKGDYNFMEVLDYNSPADLESMKESLAEGLDIFEQMFGFRARSFIPPCYTWNSDVEQTLHANGIRYIQGLVVQSVPTGTFGNYRKKYHYLGKRNSFGQYFLIRNCFFEPALTKKTDTVGECLNRIRIAFRWRKPAVISTHRLNYMGELNSRNRRDNLLLLHDLLNRIVKVWPEVEFMSSDRLGDLLAGKEKEIV